MGWNKLSIWIQGLIIGAILLFINYFFSAVKWNIVNDFLRNLFTKLIIILFNCPTNFKDVGYCWTLGIFVSFIGTIIFFLAIGLIIALIFKNIKK